MDKWINKCGTHRRWNGIQPYKGVKLRHMLQDIMLSEINQKQDKYYMISLICRNPIHRDRKWKGGGQRLGEGVSVWWVSDWEDGKAREMGCWRRHNNVNGPSATELHTLKKGWNHKFCVYFYNSEKRRKSYLNGNVLFLYTIIAYNKHCIYNGKRSNPCFCNNMGCLNHVTLPPKPQKSFREILP